MEFKLRMSFLVSQLQKKINRKEKIRVGFINSEPAKWKEASLYKFIQADDRFTSPEVIVINDTGIFSRRNRCLYRKKLQWFKKQGYATVPGYDKNWKANTLAYENYDVVFFSDINMSSFTGGHKLEKLCLKVLTCYIPYSMQLTASLDYLFNLPQFEKIWIWFFESEYVLEEKIRFSKKLIGNEMIAGFLPFDGYIESTKTKGSTVIYAPHWTNGDEWDYEYGTFEWSAPEMLKIFKENPLVKFIYRPHPLLDRSIRERWPQSLRINQDFYNRFLNDLRYLDNVKVTRFEDYIELFKDSILLITDSVSFLGEFLPTKRPVIILYNTKTHYNSVGLEIASTYYSTKDPKNLKINFDDIVLSQRDLMAAQRIKVLNKLFPAHGELCAKKIIENIFIKLNENIVFPESANLDAQTKCFPSYYV